MAVPLAQPPTTDAIANIDGNKSGSPTQGANLYSSSLARDTDYLFAGVVSDVYPSDGTCYVSAINLTKDLPCIVAGSVMSGIFGARHMGLPSIGAQVLVYVAAHGAMGYIVGVLPVMDADSRRRPVGIVQPNSAVNVHSINEIWHVKDWGAMDCLVAGGGQAADVLPGECGEGNEFGLYIGLLRLIAMLKGSDLAKVEAFAVDNLLRLTGHNYEKFTALGEKRETGFYGRVTSEEFCAFTQSESWGLTEPGSVGQKNEVNIRGTPELTSSLKLLSARQRGRWRHHKFGGWCGDMLQEFIVRPSKQDLPDEPDADQPQDGGMLHEYKSRFGRHFVRSLAGGGIHKVDRIAVPIKRRTTGEPGCDVDVQPVAIPDFSLTTGAAGEMSAGPKSADYFAYLFGKQSLARFDELKKDFFLPDETDVALIGGDSKPPGLNGFFREFPMAMDIAQGGDLVDEPAGAEAQVVPGKAWVDILPDGSVSLRDIWGSTIEMRGGKIIISASNGIDLISGGTVTTIAGDDCVVRARNSIDLSATEKQVRIKSETGTYLHADAGGIQLTAADLADSLKDGAKGEEYTIPGIVLKSGNGVAIESTSLELYLEYGLYARGRTEDDYPEVVFRSSNFLVDMPPGGAAIFQNDKDLVSLHYGMVVPTRAVYCEGDAYFNGYGFFRGALLCGEGEPSAAKKPLPSKQDFADPYREQMDGVELSGDLYSPEELQSIQFSYRSTEEYGATDGKWFQSQWQQELDGELQSWEEKPVHDTYPYPGKDHFDGGQNYFTYDPVNFDPQSGAAIARADLSADGGDLTPRSLQEFKVLPV